MRCLLVLAVLNVLVLLSLALHGVAAEPAPRQSPGLSHRVPWTTSRVVGSPDPPPPYRARRTFEKLKVECPIAVAHEPGTDSLLLVHQLIPWIGAGRILRIKEGGTAEKAEVLLSLDRTIYGLTFHPDYRKNGWLFVGSNGPVAADDRDLPGQRFKPGVVKTTRISRFTVDRSPPFACDPKSEKVIIEWPSNGHNGGDLAFGPDGMLWITSGDGTSDSDTDLAGQDLSRLLAKVLRIDVDRPPPGKSYAVPPDNPFLNTKGARPETWAYGFRNPWRIHIDHATGDVWVGNNGQDLWEQIYLVARGANYGWSLVEGTHPFYPTRKQGPTPISQPIAEHHHSEARSLTGGLVYRGTKFPDLRGAYINGDWSTGKIWGMRHDKGKVTWHRELADTPLQITGFGSDSKGELLIVDHGGGLYELEPAPPAPVQHRFPTRLSDTGLFALLQQHQPAPGVIPYSVIAGLWSDGADKERFLALPGSAIIQFTADRGWNFPDGTVLVKTFSLVLETKDGPARRRIETRLLTRQQGEWAGFSYIWNDEQTDAVLVEARGTDRVFVVADPQAPGGKREQTWHYPSRAECMVCHSRAANFVLGLTTLQMNRNHDYGGVTDNQLRALDRIGMFQVSRLLQFQDLRRRTGPIRKVIEPLPGTEKLARHIAAGLDRHEDELRRDPGATAGLPARAAAGPSLVDPGDPRSSLEVRARSYLHANCSQCHVTAGGGNAMIDLEFTTPLKKTRLVNELPLHGDLGMGGARLVVPGDPDRSILYQRLSRRGPGQMPPLATSVVDREAVQLIRKWIAGMSPEPK